MNKKHYYKHLYRHRPREAGVRVGEGWGGAASTDNTRSICTDEHNKCHWLVVRWPQQPCLPAQWDITRYTWDLEISRQFLLWTSMQEALNAVRSPHKVLQSNKKSVKPNWIFKSSCKKQCRRSQVTPATPPTSVVVEVLQELMDGGLGATGEEEGGVRISKWVNALVRYL